MKSEKEKMLAGELYLASDETLLAERQRCQNLCRDYNQTREEETDERRKLLAEIFGKETDVYIQPPFFCDYGSNVSLGKKVYFNYNCVVLDVTPVRIGDHVLFGPGVQIYAASHPLDASIRREGPEFGKAIVIGNDVWIGGGSIICPGVSIGDRSVIGAGSVVTKDIPADVLAVGNPCKIARSLI